MNDNILQTASFWLSPALAFLSFLLVLVARHRARSRHQALQGRMGRTTLSRFVQPLRGDIDLIAQIGENAGPRHSAGTTVMHTTRGLRAVSLGLSAFGLMMLFSGGFGLQGLVAESPGMVLAVCALLAVGVTEILTYELRYDREGMVLTRFMYWRRSFEWAHLMGIDDDQNYQYVLAFSRGGRVKVMKHLVGMPDFLTQVATALDRNEARHAGTARG